MVTEFIGSPLNDDQSKVMIERSPQIREVACYNEERMVEEEPFARLEGWCWALDDHLLH